MLQFFDQKLAIYATTVNTPVNTVPDITHFYFYFWFDFTFGEKIIVSTIIICSKIFNAFAGNTGVCDKSFNKFTSMFLCLLEFPGVWPRMFFFNIFQLNSRTGQAIIFLVFFYEGRQIFVRKKDGRQKFLFDGDLNLSSVFLYVNTVAVSCFVLILKS